MGYKSYGQKKRESFDYRTNYIKHNPGLFGSLYFCSQCLKVLSRHEMEVDHIVPVSKWYAPNAVYNCCAICSTCNKKKSAKIKFGFDRNPNRSQRVHFATTKGMIAKVLEELYIVIQKLLIWILKLLWSLGLSASRLLIAPLRTDRSILQKIVIVAVYFIIFKIAKSYFFGRG